MLTRAQEEKKSIMSNKEGASAANGETPNLLQDIEAAMKGAAKDACAYWMQKTYDNSKEEAERKKGANKAESLLDACGSGSGSFDDGKSQESNILYRNGKPVPSFVVEENDDDPESLKIQMPPILTPSSKAASRRPLFVANTRSGLSSVLTEEPKATSPASLSSSGSQSFMDVSVTESFTYDGRVPPSMAIDHSTSEETDDDDVFLPKQSSPSNKKQPNIVDPFAPRVGKSLVWRNVNATLAGKGDTPDRKLLKDVYGEVPAGKMTAIMGAYGAG